VTKRPQDNLALIRRVLGDDYLDLDVVRLNLEEDFVTGRSKARLALKDSQGRELEVEGEGVGLVDSLVFALLERYSAEYQSLKSIKLAGFKVDTRLDSSKRKFGADAVGEVVLDVRNSEDRHFEFADSSRSISMSSAKAVLAAIEYFINAERAFIMLHTGLRDARERQRSDLVSRYTRELAEVVKSTSYAEVIESAKKDLV
jgi:hypothetical protein